MNKPILIIDPGHGGKEDGGGTNQYWKEKDFNLKISLYQYERFKNLGIPVVLTRKEDMYLDALERVNIVKESGAKYCISNHINVGGGEGVETIHSIYNDGKLANKLLDKIAQAGQKKRRAFSRTLPNDPKKDYYYMHRETGAVVTTIVEYGFADNKKDTERLQQYWYKYAEAVVKGFCEYTGIMNYEEMIAEKTAEIERLKQENLMLKNKINRVKEILS
ncbi:N-acetylmuramoyl-L-alanine amidase [Clostridiaceae bacterium 35-E11]